MTTYSLKTIYYAVALLVAGVFYFGNVALADAATWFVRPEGGDYGAEDGSSYANAFDGFHDITWGAGGVEGSDTLYVCGTHLRDSKSNANIVSQGGWSVKVSGTETNPTTLDGSCPGGESGIMWGAYKDSRSGGMLPANWEEVQNGIYYNESKNYHKAFVSSGLFEDINGDSYKKYQQVATKDEVLNSSKSGVFYIQSTSTNRHMVWVKPFNESTFKDNIYWTGAGAWFLWFQSDVSHVLVKDLKFFATTWGMGGSLDNPVDHYTFKDVGLFPLQAGTAINPQFAEHITFDNFELAYSGTGIYFWYRSGCCFAGRYASDITIKNSYFHDIGIPWGGLNPTGAAADGHAIGVQNSERWYIHNNRFERTGSAIDFHLGGDTKFTNRDIEIIGNYITDMRPDWGRVAKGSAILFEGHNDMPKGQTSGLVVANNIINKCSTALASSRKDTAFFYNNTVTNCTNGFSLKGNRIDGASAHTYNNIILKPSDNYFYFNQNADDIQYEFAADNNVYYPDPTTAWRFHFLSTTGADYSGINVGAWPGWKDAHAKNGDIVETNTQITNPFPLNTAGTYTSIADVTPTAYSPVIDAGKNVGRTSDYFGNPIYGTPDIGAIEYQPPYTMTTNAVDTKGNIRIYRDGKYRYLVAPATTATAKFTMKPQAGFSTTNRASFADVKLTEWGSKKSWTVSNAGSAGSVIFVIGGLTPSATYGMTVGTQTITAKANTNGEASFTYIGGFSTEKSFSVVQTQASTTPAPTPTPTPTPTTPVGLIGHWTFDAADTKTNALDKSGEGNNGTFSGFTTPVLVDGKVGQAISFDGENDEVRISGFNKTLLPATFSAWVYADAIEGCDGVVFSRSTKTVGLNVGSCGATSKDKVGYHWQSSQTYGWNNGPVAPVGKWFLYTLVVEADKATAYVQTEAGLTKAVNTTTHAASAVNDLRIGGDELGRRFKGLVDDVRIYDKALTETEVKALYDATLPPPAAAQGLIGHWTFDDADVGTTVEDSSGMNNDGAFSGFTAPVLVPGAIGEAMEFDGVNDEIRITGFDQTLLPATFSAWLYTDTAQGCDGVIFSRGSVASGMNAGGCGNASEVGYHWNNSPTSYGWQGGSAVPTGKWFLYTLVVEADKATAYVYSDSGKFVTTNSVNHTAARLNDLRIGGDELGASRHFTGLIDDVRIYNKALSAAEVLDIYKDGSPEVSSDGLIGHWTFDDANVGSTIEDVSANGNDGTFSGFTTPVLVDGALDEAMEFDGANDEVRISGFNETLTMATLSAWLYTDTPGSCNGPVFSRGSNTVGLNAGMCGDATKVGYHWNTSGSYSWKGPSVPVGEWFLYTLVVEADKATAYVHTADGVEKSSNTIAHSQALINDLRIGGDELGASRHFKGLVDDVRIYNRALSESEIESLFEKGDVSPVQVSVVVPTTPTAGLVGQWSFNGATLTNVADGSDGGNNGTVSGQTSIALVDGVVDDAISFDGDNDEVRITGFNETLLPATISAWVYTDSPQGCDGVVFSRSSKTVGLNVGACGDSSKVGYHWNTSATYGWKGPDVPVGKWFLYTLVVEADKATAYVYSTSGKHSAVNTTTHAASAVNDLRIGGDELGASRHFKGLVDGVLVYNRALTANEVNDIYESGAQRGSVLGISTSRDGSDMESLKETVQSLSQIIGQLEAMI